jgi:hypothetical protein
MGIKKSRNKKYNPLKGELTSAKLVFKNRVIAYVSGKNENKCVMLNATSGKQIPVNQKNYLLSAEVRYNWTLYLIVLGLKNNNPYLEYEVIHTNTPCKQAEIAPYLNERHQALVQGFNKERLAGAAWFATNTGIDLDTEQLLFLLETLKAWD